tara:strand:- start:36 stop:695 length:660 start_codon:yes stop_codon:yes gene_type:complete
MRKKVKKVIKGLEKASKTHARQAKILKSGLKVFKARGGRDMGAGSSGMGAGKSGGFGGSGAVDTGDLGSEAANVAANVSASSHRGGGGGNGGSPSTSKVTAKKGPFQVPNIGLTAMVINQISKSLYNQKNLKEQKKIDALGGEMLTQGKRGPTQVGKGDNGGGSNTPLIKPTLKASVPKVPLPLQKIKPKTFEFNFNEGGLVRGSGKILKDRKRKVRIF